MSLKSLATNRLNYDWIGLATAILGFLMVADFSFLPPRVSGSILLLLGIANVVLAWYRAQTGAGGQRSA